jgi:hypothetical protein
MVARLEATRVHLRREAARCSILRRRRHSSPQTSASGRPLNGSLQTAQGLVRRGCAVRDSPRRRAL